MGLFRQIKDLKSAVGEAPEVAASVPLAQAPGTAPTGDPNFDAIAGVSLELYAEIARNAADTNDHSEVSLLAAAKGVSVANWDAAVEGWNARILANPNVGRRFDSLLGRPDRTGA